MQTPPLLMVAHEAWTAHAFDDDRSTSLILPLFRRASSHVVKMSLIQDQQLSILVML